MRSSSPRAASLRYTAKTTSAVAKVAQRIERANMGRYLHCNHWQSEFQPKLAFGQHIQGKELRGSTQAAPASATLTSISVLKIDHPGRILLDRRRGCGEPGQLFRR